MEVVETTQDVVVRGLHSAFDTSQTAIGALALCRVSWTNQISARLLMSPIGNQLVAQNRLSPVDCVACLYIRSVWGLGRDSFPESHMMGELCVDK